ncbi:MAG: DNA polymerase III subunit [Thermoleophilia bacterium]|nr:DNA polymerase III subunit [Thermoleophilia bacterium]
MSFERLPDQPEARRLLEAALAETPGHAYLFHGPSGVGKRAFALAFAGALLGDADRAERGVHPDVYVLEPLGEQIRIDQVRELRHDLHMRPFEASRRVYLILGADLMNEDAADALLKDLEEPPPYATIVLVAGRPAALPETIRSRCQRIPFRRLSLRALADHVAVRRPDLGEAERAAVVRVAAGRLDRAERLLDPESAAQRDRLLDLARTVYLGETFDPAAAATLVLRFASAAGTRAAERDAQGAEGTAKELEQRARRVARGVEREEVGEALELLAAWYRDVLAAALGAAPATLNVDRLVEVERDGQRVPLDAAIRAVETVADVRRSFELNVNAALALEALFVRLRRDLALAVRTA